MAKVVVTPEMVKRCKALGVALVRRATSNSALARGLGCSATQIGHLLNGRRALTVNMQQLIAGYLAIPQEMVEGYYLHGQPSLEELFTIPKLTGRIDLQTAVECLLEAPALIQIEQGLALLHKGLARREAEIDLRPMFSAICSFKAFTEYFNESVAANTRIKHLHQARAIGVDEDRFAKLLAGQVAPTVEEIGRIAAYYPDPDGDLDNPEFWADLAFPHLSQQQKRAVHPEMPALT